MFAPINRANMDGLLTFSSFGSTVGEISDQPSGNFSVPICHLLAHREEAKVAEGTLLGIFMVVPVSWADESLKKDVCGSTYGGAMDQAPGIGRGFPGFKRSRSGTGMMPALELTEGRWRV